MAIELAEDPPLFDVYGSTITHRNPKMIIDGIMKLQDKIAREQHFILTKGF